MSIDRSNQQTYSPGDTVILCPDGGVFRDRLWISSSGADGQPISYLGGNQAVISGSDLINGWSLDSGNVYRATVPIQPQQVFINGSFGDRKDSKSQLTNNRDWYWNSNNLYLYSSSGDPDNAYNNPGVEAGARDQAIYVNGASYITIAGVTAKHAQTYGIFIYQTSHYFRLLNSVAEWNYHHGVYSTGTTQHNNGLYFNNIARFNGATGFLINTNHKDTVLRRNTVYENAKHQAPRDAQHEWTAGIKMWSSFQISRAVIEDNVIFDNGYSTGNASKGIGIWIDQCAGPQGQNHVRRNLIYDNHSYGIYIEKSSNAVVSYNVLRGNADAQYSAGIGVRSSGNVVAGDNLIFNNTIVNSNYHGILCGVYDSGSVPKLVDNVFINNIVTGSAVRELMFENACTNNGYHGTGNILDSNSFGPQASGFISWDWTNLSTYNALDAAYGESTHSIRTPPQFNDPANLEFWLTPDSSGVDDGENLGPDFAEGLQQTAQWPYPVRTASQDQHGAGWEIGAYVNTEPVYIPPPN